MGGPALGAPTEHRPRRRGKWSAASSDNCPLWSARGAGVQAAAPRSGGERSERLDGGEHVRNAALSDDAVRGRQRGGWRRAPSPTAGCMRSAGTIEGEHPSLTNRGESLLQTCGLRPRQVFLRHTRQAGSLPNPFFLSEEGGQHPPALKTTAWSRLVSPRQEAGASFGF